MNSIHSGNQNRGQYPEGKDPEEILEQIERDQESQIRTQEQVKGLLKQIQHDSKGIFGSLAQYSDMIGQKVAGVREDIDAIMEIPGNPISTIEKLFALTERLSSLERMSNSLSIGMMNALRFAERIPDDVRICLEFADTGGCKKEPHEIISVLQESLATWGNDKKVNIILSLPENFSQVVYFDRVGLLRMMGNFIQNAIRFRKNDQEIAQMEISVSSDASGNIILSIKDYGRGMCARDIESYKQAHKRPVTYSAEAHVDSQRIGAASIMQVIESHGWKIDIESEVGQFIDFSITIPAVQSNQSGE